MNATFVHKFFGLIDAEAKRWINPDGSEGGIVALDAMVPVSTTVPSDSIIGPDARIKDRASIGHGVSIGYRASIGDGASIGHGVSIGYRASIGDDDWFMAIGPVGSRIAMALAVYSQAHGLRWWVGCQHGITTEQLRARVRNTHGDNEHAQDYLAAIAYVESCPGLARAMAKAGAAV